MSRPDPRQNLLNAVNVNGAAFRVLVPYAMPNAQVANAELIALRWGDATNLMVITNMSIQVKQSNVVASAETLGDVRVFHAAYSVNDSGGAAINPQQKRSAVMPASLVTDFRGASGVAAGLTLGTRTPDATPMLATSYELSTMAVTAGVYPVFASQWNDPITGAAWPLILGQNEGILVRTTTAHPATGAATLYFGIDWEEVPIF